MKLEIFVVFSSLEVHLRDLLKICSRDGVGLLKFLYGWLISFKGLFFCAELGGGVSIRLTGCESVLTGVAAFEV